MSNEPEGGAVNAHWTDEQIVAEMRRLQNEEHRTEVEAGLLVLYHGMLPLLEQMAELIEVDNAVTHYKSGELKRHKEARDKRK